MINPVKSTVIPQLTITQELNVQPTIMTTQTKRIGNILMNKVSDSDVKIGDHGIYTERKFFDDDHSKGMIRQTPKEYTFIITGDVGRAPGRYGGRRLFIKFLEHPLTPYSYSGGNYGRFEPILQTIISETPTKGWKLYKQISNNVTAQPIKGETLDFYRS